MKRREIKYGFLYLTKNEFSTFRKNRNSYLYLVYYKDGAPKLKVLDRDTVLGNARISVRYQLRWRKKQLESFEEIEL